MEEFTKTNNNLMQVLELLVLCNALLVYYSIGLTESALQFWQKIDKSGGGYLLIRHQFLMLVSVNKHCTIFSCIFCLMFLIDAIKLNADKKF